LPPVETCLSCTRRCLSFNIDRAARNISNSGTIAQNAEKIIGFHIRLILTYTTASQVV
jgi:hypothetical protein